MTGATTEPSHYTHCVALLFLAALGLTGLIQDVAACVDVCSEGKMTFPGEISHKKLNRASESSSNQHCNLISSTMANSLA